LPAGWWFWICWQMTSRRLSATWSNSSGGWGRSCVTAGALPLQRQVELRGKIEIPGPIRSFSRMAALSPICPGGVAPRTRPQRRHQRLPGISSAEALEMTEYLKLVVRYLSQARELGKLSGSERVLKIETCESALTNDLLRVLGYRMRGGCGAEVVLETVTRPAPSSPSTRASRSPIWSWRCAPTGRLFMTISRLKRRAV